MRSFAMRGRLVAFSCTASILVLSGILAGCSTDFDRFARSALPSKVDNRTTSQTNPYPGDVDSTTTSSVGRRMVPSSDVVPLALANTPKGVYHKPEPTYAVPAQDTARATYVNPYPSGETTGSVQRNDLPQALGTPVSYAAPSQETAYSTPKVVPASRVEPSEANTTAGWGQSGGVSYTVKSGETLYNLSKRFGVPVSALMAANGMNDADSVQAGQTIVIPNYNYGKDAPVSAPDNNPKTKAARATTGLVGETDTADKALPARRPSIVASNNEPSVRETATDSAKNDELVTGSVSPSGVYTVKSGDSLSRIASRNGTTVEALKSHNALSGNQIQVGQTLRIPGSDGTQLASITPAGVDPITTGTPTKIENPAAKITETAYSKPDVTDAVVDNTKAAPKASGISEFRWPVKGRVVTKFGEKDGAMKNDGIDISVPEGTAVRSAENGVVIYAGNDIEAYGNLMLIRHENGWVSAYAHTKSFDVKKGDSIRRGQIIARSGRTGTTQQPKLHFELRKDSNPVDPLGHLSGA